MLIYTDNPDYLRHIFTSTVQLKPADQKSIPEILSEINRQLYSDNRLYLGSTEKSSSFKHFYISKYVPFSQYDMLLQFARSIPDFRENILCFAGSGINFHGFRQRKWISVIGNIHLSLLLHPGQPVERAEIAFLILAANAAAQTINQLKRVQTKAKIRWVNDITINRCKVGGVLAQTQIQGKTIDKVVLGIGLNVNRSPEIDNDQFVNTATHINDHTDGLVYPLNEVLDILISRLEYNYSAILEKKFPELLDYYINHSMVIGEKVEVYSDPREGRSTKVAEGIVTGITENLELILSGQKELVRKGRIKLINNA